MITETIVYKNFNDEDDARTVNFHISEAVLMENLNIRDRIATLAEILSGPTRQLSTVDIQEIVDLVKWLMSISYGVKSVDGSSFEQDPIAGTGPVWQAFKNTAAYNTFLMSLFKEPEKAVTFILAVLPAELRRQAEASADTENPMLKNALKGAEKANRAAPGTKIVDEYTTPPATNLSSVPDPEEPDYESMLLEVDDESEEPAKQPISQKQYNHMKARLSDRQFIDFMSTRELITE